jgi:hypothetical protein
MSARPFEFLLVEFVMHKERTIDNLLQPNSSGVSNEILDRFNRDGIRSFGGIACHCAIAAAAADPNRTFD